jgi:hypothetical protein
MPRPGSVKTLVDVRSLARSYTTLAVNTLAGIARSPKCPAASRVQASIALLDRGFGRPTSENEESQNEIRVIIRHIVEPLGSPKVIEHEQLDDEGSEGA